MEGGLHPAVGPCCMASCPELECHASGILTWGDSGPIRARELWASVFAEFFS